MAIFKYEMRQLRNYTLWWAVALALFIFLILPSYVSMLAGGATDMGALEGNPMFDMLGVDVNVISTPIGCFGFINAFLAIAGGIGGMFLGLRAFTKETVQKTADYIYTKPYRRGLFFLSKLLSAFISIGIAGICYFIGSVVGGFSATPGGLNIKTLSLLVVSFFLIQFYFVIFGAFVGAVYSKIRSPLLISSGAVFMLYVLSTFASKVGNDLIKFATPFSYFGASGIIVSGGYNAPYMLTYVILCAAFGVIGYITFN
ncbi:MAG: ABC transporter permease, partial [Oscillospiraceae bacterium]|nr:ABC transporter permease [Oscillospiraceae bacterium]